eukprot:605962-Amphidinium_carterae.1
MYQCLLELYPSWKSAEEPFDVTDIWHRTSHTASCRCVGAIFEFGWAHAVYAVRQTRRTQRWHILHAQSTTGLCEASRFKTKQ